MANCTEPKFICHDGICDTDLVAATIQHDIAPRCRRLLHLLALEPETVEDPWAAIPVPIKFQTNSVGITTETSVTSVTEPAQAQPSPSPSTVIDLISDVWNGSEPINYHAQIHIGTPPVPFTVDLDTGSSLLWLQSVLSPITDLPLPTQPAYDPTRSLTSLSQNSRTKVTYADGSSLIASLFTDVVQVGTLRALSQPLGAAATHNISGAFLGGASHGILGLGDFGRKNLVQTLKSQGQLRHAAIALIGPRNDPKLAEVIDRERTLQPRGSLVLGTVERRFYTGEIAWCPVVFQGGREMWLVRLDEIRVNGHTVATGQQALIDTGTAYIVASQPAFRAVKAAIPGAEDIVEKDLEKRKGKQKQSAMFSFPSASLRSVEFVFGGRSMQLRRQDFGLGQIRVGEAGNRMCASIVQIPGDEGREVFRGREQMWIVGGIFLDNIVTVFDFEKRRVGFATIATEGVGLARI